MFREIQINSLENIIVKKKKSMKKINNHLSTSSEF